MTEPRAHPPHDRAPPPSQPGLPDPASGPPPSPQVPRAVLVGGLGLAQILGWGTTFYLPSVLGAQMGAELDLGQGIVFGGVTVMYLVGALLAPRLGREIDARGARPVMTAGTVLAAAALALLGLSQGLATYVGAWMALGLTLPMTLGHASYAAIAQSVPGAGARRAMTLMTLITGVTSTIAWPVTAALEAWLGWRGTCLVFSASHLVVALPLYLAVLPRRALAREPAAAAAQRPPTPLPPRLLVLLAVALGLPNATSAGLSLVSIALLAELGHAPAAAIALAALHGPAQIAARIVDLALGTRSRAMATGLFAAALMPLALLPLLGGERLWLAALFMVAFGVSSGLMTVVRAALPLELAGAAGYGALTGRISLPGNVMIAVAPPLFAAALEHTGPLGTAGLAGIVSLVALAAMAALALSDADRSPGASTPAERG